jgi:uncharacterized RDD family membrane protein YckC
VNTGYLASVHSPGLQGHYAGIVTRFGTFVVDLLIIAIGFAIGGRVVEFVLSVLLRKEVDLSDSSFIGIVAFVIWAFTYCAYPLATAGRTFGMAVLGVRAVRVDGTDLDTRHAVLRVLVFPLSFLLLGFGFVLILLRRDRRALHDLVARSAVVYSWDARAARLRFLLKR